MLCPVTTPVMSSGARLRGLGAETTWARPLELTQRRVIDFCVVTSTACCR